MIMAPKLKWSTRNERKNALAVKWIHCDGFACCFPQVYFFSFSASMFGFVT